jgi:hypothetical protein
MFALCTERDRREESGADGENPDRIKATKVREKVRLMRALRGSSGPHCGASENREEKPFLCGSCVLQRGWHLQLQAHVLEVQVWGLHFQSLI